MYSPKDSLTRSAQRSTCVNTPTPPSTPQSPFQPEESRVDQYRKYWHTLSIKVPAAPRWREIKSSSNILASLPADPSSLPPFPSPSLPLLLFLPLTLALSLLKSTDKSRGIQQKSKKRIKINLRCVSISITDLSLPLKRPSMKKYCSYLPIRWIHTNHNSRPDNDCD